MLKKTITYVDYDNNERTEDHYFNLSKAEVQEMELTTSGGYAELLNRIVAAADLPAIYKTFKEFVLRAYGEKTPDGKRFVKSEALSTAFSQTEAYVVLMEELTSDAKKAAEFVNAVMPAPKAEAPNNGPVSVPNAN